MNRKSANTAMIAVICAVIVIIFAAVVVLMTRGSNGSDAEDDSGGPLPDSYLGSWALPGDSHVLQSPRNADVTEDDALADENDFGVMITYGAYTTHRVGSVSNPFYRMQQNCTPEDMDAEGMQSSGIMDEFNENASITRIEIFDKEGGNLCDTVFILDDQYLIYYGTGNYVFCAVKLDAVG